MFAWFRLFALCLALFMAGCDAPEESALPTSGAVVSADLPWPTDIAQSDAVWEAVAGPFLYSDGPTADADGNVYFAVTTSSRIFRLSPAGEVSLFAEGTAMSMGLRFGPDDKLYACRNLDAQIVAYDAAGNFEILLQGELTPVDGNPQVPGEFCNDLAVSSAGDIWFTDRENEAVVFLGAGGESRVVASGFRANGIALSADEQMLVVTDSKQPRLWAFEVGAGGTLAELPGYFDPVVLGANVPRDADKGEPGTNGMTIDEAGRFFVATYAGIQVFTPDGKSLGVITRPGGYVSSVAFGGQDSAYLYATGLRTVYRIETLTRGLPNVRGFATHE